MTVESCQFNVVLLPCAYLRQIRENRRQITARMINYGTRYIHIWFSTYVRYSRRLAYLRVFTGKREGVLASGVGGQGLKPLPSQSYHQIAVGAQAASLFTSLSFSRSLSLYLSFFPSHVLFLVHFVRIHDLNSIAFYLLFRAPKSLMMESPRSEATASLSTFLHPSSFFARHSFESRVSLFFYAT